MQGGIMVFQDFLIGLLLLVVGAAFCFVGYRFFRILIAIWGFFAGFNLGASGMVALFGQNFLGTVTGWVLGIVVGLVIAVLAYFRITLPLWSWGHRSGMQSAAASWVPSD